MRTDMARDAQPGGDPPLDPALLQVIRPSANRMAAAEGSFIRLLHEDAENLVRELPDNGWGFCERTVRTVLWLILAEQPLELGIEGLYWLGSTNQAEGFPASEYVSVGHSLVRVVRDMSGDRWATTMGSAWIRFFMWMQPYLQAGAQQMAAQQEAERRRAAAQQEAARRHAFDQVARRSGSADVDVSVVGDMLDDEEDEDAPAPGYGQIMLGMTSGRRRPR
ncbi:MAG: hypothetical protein J2P25_15480 [Nocardiopsaceae bacterium]|nr:hypothetical protein [Nocardiopsaceae bacterium]